jgi:hypothetical protein
MVYYGVMFIQTGHSLIAWFNQEFKANIMEPCICLSEVKGKRGKAILPSNINFVEKKSRFPHGEPQSPQTAGEGAATQLGFNWYIEVV